MEKKVEESSRTEHYSETETSDSDWQLVSETDKFPVKVGGSGNTGTVVAGTTTVTTGSGATVEVKGVDVQTALAQPGAKTVHLLGDASGQVTIKAGQRLTSDAPPPLTIGMGNQSVTVALQAPASPPTIEAAVSGGPVVTMESGSTLHHVNVTNTSTEHYSTGILVTPGGGTAETLISRSTVTTSGGEYSHGVHFKVFGNATGGLRVTNSTINTSAQANSYGVQTIIGDTSTYGSLKGNIVINEVTIDSQGYSSRGVSTAVGQRGTMTGELTIEDSTINADFYGVYTDVQGSMYTNVQGSMNALSISGSTITGGNKGVYTDVLVTGTMGAMTINNVDWITGTPHDVERKCRGTCGAVQLYDSSGNSVNSKIVWDANGAFTYDNTP